MERPSHLLSLTSELSWRLIAHAGTEDWLERMACLLHIESKPGPASVRVRFVAGTRRWFRRRGWGDLAFELKRADLPPGDWTCQDFGLVRLWHHPESADLVCELDRFRAPGLDVVLMWDSLHALYRGVVLGRGFPLHSALVERDGAGFLLVGGSGVGKSTCCQRIPPPWSALSDDGALVVPNGDAGFTVHPLPTWSDHILNRPTLPCLIERGVNLHGIFFLEHAERDEVVKLGAGTAAVWLSQSASVLCGRGRQKWTPAQESRLNRDIFENACEVVKSAPAFTLRVSRDGRFWDEMDRVLFRQGYSL